MKSSPGPWNATVSIMPDTYSAGRLIIEDCNGNSVCATSLRGVQGDIDKMHANANLIAAAPELLDTRQGNERPVWRRPASPDNR